MGTVNVNLLKARIIEQGRNIESLAESIGISKDTLYRKLRNGGADITIREANSIINELNLTEEDALAIFLP